MTKSIFNQRRRRQRRKDRDSEKRRMRRTGGNWKNWYSPRSRPNAQDDTFYQSKDKR